MAKWQKMVFVSYGGSFLLYKWGGKRQLKC